ncbi:MAG: hypothetical protein ACOYB3_01145 [Azonexus sp.]
MKNTKAVTPKPLASIDVPLAPATAEATSAAPDKLTVILGSEEVPSTDVKDYNHASAQEKAWKKIKDEANPKLAAKALTRLYEHNTENPDSPVKTVCLVDTTGAACNVSLKDTYDKAQHDPEKVSNGLLALGQRDPNKFVAEKVIIGFDTSVFYDDQGKLRKELYVAMMEAIQDVAAEHQVASPFSSSKVVTVKPGFAETRWKVFTEQQQEQVSKLFPAQVSLTPLAPEKKPKA